jgi:hypothetical protein
MSLHILLNVLLDGGVALLEIVYAVDLATHALTPVAMSEHSPPQEAHWPEGAIFTLGHSTLPIERFLALLQTYGIERLVDIRTMPARMQVTITWRSRI